VRMRFVGLPMIVKYPPYDSGLLSGQQLRHGPEIVDPAAAAWQARSPAYFIRIRAPGL
jgi:hypothetical protein